MAEFLNIAQLKKLQEVMIRRFAENDPKKKEIENWEYVKLFLDAKKIEGCSNRTIKYYRVTLEHLFKTINTPVRKITTSEIRTYLVDYQKISSLKKKQMNS